MATYDLEQQEQLDQVKHLWAKYGNLVSWVLFLAVGAYAAWMGYQYWETDRAYKAGGLYEELDRKVNAGDADRAGQAFNDLKNNYAGTTYAEQGALLAARVQALKGKDEPARASLTWEIEHGKNPNLVAIARLRLAGLLLDAKQYDAALAQVKADLPEEFKALADDRRGDILASQGKKDEAVKAYEQAYKALDPAIEYRRFVEGKLTALGHAPAPAAAASTPEAAKVAP
jgi:predicted negative regulator of RcsB-dependent stress response